MGTSAYMYTNLHTKSSYMGTWRPQLEGGNANYEDTIYKNMIDNAIKALEDKETAFAMRFGYNNCQELIAAIQQLFQQLDSQNDLAVLQRYKSDALRAALHANFDNNSALLEDKTVRLVLDSTKTNEQLDKIIQELNKACVFDISNGEGIKIIGRPEDSKRTAVVTIGWDVPKVKQIVNAIQSKHYVYNKNLSASKSDYRIVQQFIDEIDSVGRRSILTVEKDKKPNQYYKYDFRASPLAYKPSELDNLSTEEITKIGNLIYNFITVTLARGASQEMREAISTVWNQNFAGPRSLGVEFFLHGKGWIDHLIGALGEFITPVFFYYCAKRLPKAQSLIPTFMSIVGSQLNRFNEQKSIDIEIAFFRHLGIQVKNYNGAFWRDANTHAETSKERTIDVNLHPSDISTFAQDERIVPYIINSYFNVSIPKIPEDELNKFFEFHAFEFLNLAIDDSNIEDRAVFYLIGGSFIPGSEILRAAFIQKSITVSNTTMKLKGDADFANDAVYNGYIGGEPVFLHWWTGNQFIDWEPTKNNTLLSYERNILIHTRFTYAALFKAYQVF